MFQNTYPYINNACRRYGIRVSGSVEVVLVRNVDEAVMYPINRALILMRVEVA